MKKTQLLSIFPLNKGLDLSSVPGTQDPRSLKRAKNIVLRSKPSIKKRPGLRRIPYVGDDVGVQAAIHFFGTVGGAQASEIVRVRKGRIEVIRNNNIVDLGVQVSDSDTIVFEKFVNILIIHFENTAPYYYSIGGVLNPLSILPSHKASPPIFSRFHDFRLFYGGRPQDPHKLWASAVNNAFDYSLNGGGFSMRVRDGDGDPVGLTGLSPTFRGDLYAYKWNSIYRIYGSEIGYGIDQLTNEVGCVHHNTICMTQNDIFSVAMDGIHSLILTDKYGAAEAYTVTYPIYEYFQESVNWSNAKNMIATYDKPTNTYLLSFTSSGSAVNNRVLGFNTVSKEFFEWDDVEYPAIGRYFDFGRQMTFVSAERHGICLVDDKINTLVGDPIELDILTGVVFPLGNPKATVTFTKGWLLVRPTPKSVYIDVTYTINGEDVKTIRLDSLADGEGALITNDPNLTGIIGIDKIGKMAEDMVVLPFDMGGDGSAIQFRIHHMPPELDADQSCEVFGIYYEIDYTEDAERTVQI